MSTPPISSLRSMRDERHEFLINVNYSRDPSEEERAWVRVRILEEWDIAGSEVEQLRGGFAGMFTTGNGTVSTIVIRPE